ncbi:shikimate dehydrogenase [Psychromicrobium lacuslunae]|uniref:Shikimate dehydrogenase n=1 Tax=Psychromicrobium lacuslunae TaxID=1618207 RepID=A0A0D4C2Q9_9MICC|nr:shikimate dehydrogenase [Psychromicrobium lacuslunae]AJT42888.1 shikimate dehydrogenase [Psychromicrobium lacuslunae]
MSPAKAAVIGHPIAHSKSPALHRAAYRWLGVDIDYQAIDVSAGELPGLVQRLREQAGWRGLSVTMPHKAAIADLVDEVDPVAAKLGVLNTVRVREDGALIGSNTDVAGIINALQQAGLRSVETFSRPPIVLGGGGTALAALAALAELGGGEAQLYLRNPDKLGALAVVADRLGLSLEVLPLAALSALRAELVLSTLPPGAADELLGSVTSSAGYLLDVAYDPWPSALASAWQAAGGTVVSGLEMLLYQAVEQVALFSGVVISDRNGLVNVMCDSIGLPRR